MIKARCYFVEIHLPAPEEEINAKTFHFKLKQEKLADAELFDGHYLLRTNLARKNPDWLWKLYMLLVQIEGVFRSFKNDLKLRPIYHQVERRVEAHIFVCFLSYCLYVLLQKKLMALAPGLTVRQALDQLAAVKMIDVAIPTTDGKTLTMSRSTQPDKTVQLLLSQLKMQLPEQSPPRLSAGNKLET